MSKIVSLDKENPRVDQSDHSKLGHVVTKFSAMPEDLPISCPKINFNIGRAGKRCPDCEHFKGLLCMSDDESEVFRHRFRVLCAYPIARGLGNPMEDLD